MNKICCFIGVGACGFAWRYAHNAYNENEWQWEYEELLAYILERDIKNGYTHFICGKNKGAETDFVNAVKVLRERYPNITLDIVDKITKKHVDGADKIFAVWNASEKGRTFRILRYAWKHNVKPAKPMEYIMLPAFHVRQFRKYIDLYIEYDTSLEKRKRKDQVFERLVGSAR